MKRTVLLLIIMPMLFAAKAADSLGGYKNAAWKMTPGQVDALFYTNRTTTKDSLSGMRWGTTTTGNSTICVKYLDQSKNVLYFFHFFRDRLYRIDMANYAGPTYDDLNINYPISASQRQSLEKSFRELYGDPDKIEKPPFIYERIFYRDQLLWWHGETVTVSLMLREVPIIDKTFSYRISFYYEPIFKELAAFRIEPDIAKALDLK
ncbi:MAG: hypothetical protein AABZ39_10760 [Spirochaetota bacterium]